MLAVSPLHPNDPDQQAGDNLMVMFFRRKNYSGEPSGRTDMSDDSDTPDVKIIPPLVYLVGIVIGFLATIWMPTKVVSNSVAWTVGGIFTFCGRQLLHLLLAVKWPMRQCASGVELAMGSAQPACASGVCGSFEPEKITSLKSAEQAQNEEQVGILG
jgi:hypothetical protein